jgi:hypothetical protein
VAVRTAAITARDESAERFRAVVWMPVSVADLLADVNKNGTKDDY